MIFANFRMALKAIWGSKLRSTLTILGIVIGIAAVISMLSVGKGAEQYIASSIEKMGTNILMVRSGGGWHSPRRSAKVAPLELEDADLLRKHISVPVLVSPEITTAVEAKFENKHGNTALFGVALDYFESRSFEIEKGRFFTNREDVYAQKVCVIGKTVVDSLFPNYTSPVGKTIRVRRIPFTVIGVYKEKGSSGWGNTDDRIFIPATTMIKRITGSDRVRSIYVSVSDREHTDQAEAEITSLLRRKHRLRSGQPDDFSIRSQLEFLEASNNVTKAFSLLLGSIAFISLLVGGIGIMNILLVSVTERTKEIGIRKAIGAYESDILNQFLTESITLCLIGGILGIILGISITQIIGLFSQWPPVISVTSIGIAFVVALITGIFFGYYPAKLAARMKPVDALRYE